MFGSGGSGRRYEPLPQRDAAAPGLFSGNFRRPTGLSFDYIPNVSENDFTDASQGWTSWMCHMVVIGLVYVCTFITFPVTGWFVLKTVPNYERMVVFRLGRVGPPKGPGMVLVLPLIDQGKRVDLRTRAFNIPPCQVRVRDGGVLSVGADIQFRIWNPVLSVMSVQDLNASTRMTAQNALTHSLSRKSLQEVQTERIKLGEYLGVDLNQLTQPWGLEVDRVELTLGSYLRASDEPSPAASVLPPSVPGLDGIAGPIQQLAMHFLNHGGHSLPPHGGDSVMWTDEQSSASASASASASSASAASASASVSEVWSAVQQHLSDDLVRRVGASFQFDLSSQSGHNSRFYLDLSRGSGSVGSGSLNRDPDVTLSLSDSDLVSMFRGELQPYAAYAGGRLQIQGDLNTALSLQEVIKLIKR